MADFADSCVRSDMDEIKTQLPIWSENPADVASPYALSSSVSEAAKNDDEELKKLHQSHEKVLENNSCGNPSNENASMEQVVGCNIVAALQGDANDADCTRSKYGRCGMHEDLLFDIMLWLPVASLLRFRSVCRLWRSLIDSSAFVTQHYHHNSNKSCLLVHHVVSSFASCDSKFCLLGGNKYEVYGNLDYKQPWCSVNETSILNSCNGIVSLLNKKSGDVALWNPATKQLRPLPESSRYNPSVMDVEFGFGFDAKSNDYKVVKILYRYINKDDKLVEVYSLRTDSWRTIHKDDVLPFQSINCHRTIFKDGKCFWTGYSHPNEDSPILVYFDLNNEVFETMLLPGEQDPHHWLQYYTALDLLNDKLCFIKGIDFDTFNYNERYCEIWMLGENGVKEEPWTKIYELKPTGSLEWDPPNILGISKNAEFILQGYKYECSELYLSNFDAQEEEYCELQGPKRLPDMLENSYHDFSTFVCYNESLVSLKREDDGTYK